MAFPCGSVAISLLPAATSPFIFRDLLVVQPGKENAYPSMEDWSKAGMLMEAYTSSANTMPAASDRGNLSGGNGVACSRINCFASVTEIMLYPCEVLNFFCCNLRACLKSVCIISLVAGFSHGYTQIVIG